jgi:hypothetical protein
MSIKEEPKSYRSMMSPVASSDKSHFADVLGTIDPRNLPALTRTISPFATATLLTVSASAQKEKIFQNAQGMKYDVHTLSGRMDLWQFTYDEYQISNDGQGRKEIVDVLKLAAIGGSDESGQIAQSVLNEGAKVLTSKEKK